MNPAQLIQLVYRVLPYSSQIRDLEIFESFIEFRWRSQHFRVTGDLSADTVGDGVLIGDDNAMLLGALLSSSRI